MKKAFVIVSIALLLTACAVPKTVPDTVALVGISGGLVEPVPLEFLSIDPRSSPWYEKETSSGLKRVYWEDLSNDKANADLSIERSFVSVKKETADGSLGFASARFTAEAGKYKTVLDYAKYRDEQMGEEKRPVRVGVGVRIIANITTTKANIDLGSLFAIAFAAKAGYLSGQIEVLKIGIESPGLSMVLPPPTDINDTSMQNALQAVAAIRAKLYDSDTKLRPHVLAVQWKQAGK